MLNPVIQAVRTGEIDSVRAALRDHPSAALHPGTVLAAAGSAFLPALKLLVRSGAGLNGLYRGYRPLHALLQENPPAPGEDPAPGRLACLDWMMAHGADAELTAAWPPARALIVSAFAGVPAYVEHLCAAGARVDGFAAAALGDIDLVRSTLRADPAFVHARDHDVLTALHCAAGSRLPGAPVAEIARLLLDSGAGLTARARSWNHEVDAVYFAANARNRDVFALLLDRGADPTAALTPSLWNATEEFAELALAHGAVPDRATAGGQPLLNNLVRWGRLRQSLWLLERNASPNIPDARGWTAVHQAASRGNERLFRAIVGAGGDLARRTLDGDTPIDIAVESGRVKLLAAVQRALTPK